MIQIKHGKLDKQIFTYASIHATLGIYSCENFAMLCAHVLCPDIIARQFVHTNFCMSLYCPKDVLHHP
jgi:hypothetical protein